MYMANGHNSPSHPPNRVLENDLVVGRCVRCINILAKLKWFQCERLLIFRCFCCYITAPAPASVPASTSVSTFIFIFRIEFVMLARIKWSRLSHIHTFTRAHTHTQKWMERKSKYAKKYVIRNGLRIVWCEARVQLCKALTHYGAASISIQFHFIGSV